MIVDDKALQLHLVKTTASYVHTLVKIKIKLTSTAQCVPPKHINTKNVKTKPY